MILGLSIPAFTLGHVGDSRHSLLMEVASRAYGGSSMR